MKKEFSTKWKASKQPRKQRKYLANAPLHIKQKFLSVNLSKDLRKKHGKRNIEIRVNDSVKIMRGKFKNKSGKVLSINRKLQKIYVEGIQVKKQDGSKANVPIKSSNLQITTLNLDDKKRLKTEKQNKDLEKTTGNKNKETEKKEKKPLKEKTIKKTKKDTEKEIKIDMEKKNAS